MEEGSLLLWTWEVEGPQAVWNFDTGLPILKRGFPVDLVLTLENGGCGKSVCVLLCFFLRLLLLLGETEPLSATEGCMVICRVGDWLSSFGENRWPFFWDWCHWWLRGYMLRFWSSRNFHPLPNCKHPNFYSISCSLHCISPEGICTVWNFLFSASVCAQLEPSLPSFLEIFILVF